MLIDAVDAVGVRLLLVVALVVLLGLAAAELTGTTGRLGSRRNPAPRAAFDVGLAARAGADGATVAVTDLYASVCGVASAWSAAAVAAIPDVDEDANVPNTRRPVRTGEHSHNGIL